MWSRPFPKAREIVKRLGGGNFLRCGGKGVPASRPAGPWALGPMDPWAHGLMGSWAHGQGFAEMALGGPHK